MNENLKLGIWVAVIAVVFIILWRKGMIERLRLYIAETQEELKKCSWPTWAELRGSTAVVGVSIILLGAFTVGVDFVLTQLVRLII